MKSIILVFLGLLSFSIICEGQKQIIPGYLGKRMTFEVTPHFFPSIFNPNTRNQKFGIRNYNYNPNSLTSFSYRTEMAFSYVLSRNTSVLAHFDFGKNGSRNINAFDITSPEGYVFSGNAFYLSSFKTFGVGFLFKRTKSWGLPPLGNYFGLKIMRTSAQGKIAQITNEDYNWEDDFDDYDISIDKKENTVLYNFVLTFGNKQILYNNLFVNMGCNFGAATMLQDISTILIADSVSDDYTIKRGIAHQYAIDLHLGLGYIF